MTAVVTLQEAQAHLAELIDRLEPGEEVVITRDQRPVAKLVGERPMKRLSRVPGNCQGMLTVVAEDDEHWQDFREYLP